MLQITSEALKKVAMKRMANGGVFICIVGHPMCKEVIVGSNRENEIVMRILKMLVDGNTPKDEQASNN